VVSGDRGLRVANSFALDTRVGMGTGCPLPGQCMFECEHKLIDAVLLFTGLTITIMNR
jgi:hypothetical protein